MSNSSAEIPYSPQEARWRAGRGRFYIFTVVALATFLVGLASSPPPTMLFQVGAELDVALPSDKEAGLPAAGTDGAALVDQLLTPEALRRALRAQANPPATDDPAADEARIAALRRRLIVTAASSAAPGHATLSIQYTDRRADDALALVDALAWEMRRQLLGRPASPAENRPAQAAAEKADAAAQRAQQARARLDNFVQTHVKTLQAAREKLVAAAQTPARPATNSEASAPANTAPAGVAAAAGKRTISPPEDTRRAELQQALDEALSQRDQLLVRLTAQHPLVRDAELQIAELQQRLETLVPPAGTPYISARLSPTHPPEKPPAAPQNVAPPPAPITQQEIDDAIARFRELRGQWEAAEAQLAEAVKNEREAWKTGVAPATALAEITQPARVLARLGGTFSTARAFVWGGLALGLGGLVFWAAAVAQRAGVIVDVSHLQTLLSLPLVGTLSTADGPAIVSHGALARRVVRWTTCLSELILAVAVVAMLWALAVDSPLSLHFSHDPFVAFSQAVRRLLGWGG